MKETELTEALERIGRQLAAKRKEKGLTVRQLSTLSGVNYCTISSIETGKRNASVAVLSKIATPLGLSVNLD